MPIPAYVSLPDALFGTGKAIPASMLLGLRNNMWADNLKTEEVSTGKVLRPNGSGGVAWVASPAGRVVYHTYDSGTISFWSGSPVNMWLDTLTMESGGGVLHIEAKLTSSAGTLGYLPGTLVVTSGVNQPLNIPVSPKSSPTNGIILIAQMSGQNVEFGIARMFTSGTDNLCRLQLTVYGFTAAL